MKNISLSHRSPLRPDRDDLPPHPPPETNASGGPGGNPLIWSPEKILCFGLSLCLGLSSDFAPLCELRVSQLHRDPIARHGPQTAVTPLVVACRATPGKQSKRTSARNKQTSLSFGSGGRRCKCRRAAWPRRYACPRKHTDETPTTRNNNENGRQRQESSKARSTKKKSMACPASWDSRPALPPPLASWTRRQHHKGMGGREWGGVGGREWGGGSGGSGREWGGVDRSGGEWGGVSGGERRGVSGRE